jgi:hypothetical protein
MLKRNLIALFMIGAQLSGCKSAESVLKVSEMPNYDKKSADRILFLNFRISTTGNSLSEKVELVNAVSGNARMKNLIPPVHDPYQIKVIPRYSASRMEMETFYEHPLFRSVEVSGPGGKLGRSQINDREGMLNIRVQDDSYLTSLEVYSVTPEKGTVKIYTLNFKR